MDNVASFKKEGLDPPVSEEAQTGTGLDQHRGFVHVYHIVIICVCWPDGDRTVVAKLASPVAAETMVNGTECDNTTHKNLLTANNKTVLLLNENGTSDTEPPHASVTGSNGLILTKQQQEAAGSGVSPHRTNRSPSGSPTGVQTANPLPASASAGSVPSPGALRTAPSTGTLLGQGTSDTKNGPAASPVSTSAPVTVHRARKTMSRPAVSPAQKVEILFYTAYDLT